MESSAMIRSSHDQKAHQETPHCSSSPCNMELAAAVGCFTITDDPLLSNAISESSKRFNQSPKIGYFGDGHRCKRFPCPICNPGRSQRTEGMPSTALILSQMLELSALKSKRLDESPEIASFGDGHRCKRFPCPICNPGRSQRTEGMPSTALILSQMLELSALKSKRLDESPETASFGDGHRCKRFPCPICNPGRSQRTVLGMSSTAPVLMSQMMEFISQVNSVQPRPHGHDQAAPVHIVFGDGGHTCRRFPCPICHTGRRTATRLEVVVE